MRTRKEKDFRTTAGKENNVEEMEERWTGSIEREEGVRNKVRMVKSSRRRKLGE